MHLLALNRQPIGAPAFLADGAGQVPIGRARVFAGTRQRWTMSRSRPPACTEQPGVETAFEERQAPAALQASFDTRPSPNGA